MARLFNNITLSTNLSLKQRIVNVFGQTTLEVGNPWFEEIEPTSFYNEEDLERSVLLNLQKLFPDFIAVTFKRKVRNTKTGIKNAPDLTIIKKDYSEWYIIEVELSNHNIKHIEQQVGTFFHANYDKTDSDYLIKKDKGLFDEDRLENLICSEAPKLLVIANSANEAIKNSIDVYSCSLCIFQMFLDKDGNPFYRLDGEYPLVYSQFCFCRLTKRLPFTIQLLDDLHFRESYELVDKKVFNIQYNGVSTKWEVSINGKETYLICLSDSFPLEPSTRRYQLSYNDTLNLFSFNKA